MPEARPNVARIPGFLVWVNYPPCLSASVVKMLELRLR
jgi:hypothetical protein